MDTQESLGVAVVLSIACIWAALYFLGEEGEDATYTEIFFHEPFENINIKELGDPITFTVDNNEGGDVRYVYNVSVEYRTAIKHGHMDIRSDELPIESGKSVNITFNIPKSMYRELLNSQKTTVYVRLWKEGYNGVYREIKREIVQ